MIDKLKKAPPGSSSGSVTDPNAGTLRSTWWNGRSKYNGLQLQINKPLAHGIQAQASYTWSECTDDGSEASRGDQFQNGIITPIFFDMTHRTGPCAFDLRLAAPNLPDAPVPDWPVNACPWANKACMTTGVASMR